MLYLHRVLVSSFNVCINVMATSMVPGEREGQLVLQLHLFLPVQGIAFWHTPEMKMKHVLWFIAFISMRPCLLTVSDNTDNSTCSKYAVCSLVKHVLPFAFLLFFVDPSGDTRSKITRVMSLLLCQDIAQNLNHDTWNIWYVQYKGTGPDLLPIFLIRIPEIAFF